MISKIAILGDFNPAYPTLHALNDSTRLVQKQLGREIQFDWIPTDIFNNKTVFENQKYCGLWIAPGSPYKDMENVLTAIKYARENKVPTLGNCGGFQHMIIEFARNVCQIQDANSEEINPEGKDLLISKLNCSLLGEQEELEIITTESKLHGIVKQTTLLGKYFCGYGLSNSYLSILQEKGFLFTSKSNDLYRSFELKDHPFYIGTLFQPALTSTDHNVSAIIVEFVKECLKIK